jgi:hypothetical protein
MKGLALAPSQHPRSILGRTRRTSRAALVTVVLLVAAVALSACGNQQAGAAAIVDGTSISEKDVQTVTTQLNTLAQGGQKLSQSIVLVNLILAPYVLAEADRAGKGVPDAQAQKAIAKVDKPSRQTLDFVRMQLAIPSLTDPAKAAILAKVAKAGITVNPRYGTFDAKQIAISPSSPNWIKASAPAAPK